MNTNLLSKMEDVAKEIAVGNNAIATELLNECIKLAGEQSAPEEHLNRLNKALGMLAPKGYWFANLLESIYLAKTTEEAVELARSARVHIDKSLSHGPSEQTEGIEPVAWASESGKVVSASGKLRMEEAEHPVGIHYDIPLYAHPPQPIGLSDENIERIAMEWSYSRCLDKHTKRLDLAEDAIRVLRYARDNGYLNIP